MIGTVSRMPLGAAALTACILWSPGDRLSAEEVKSNELGPAGKELQTYSRNHFRRTKE